MPSEVSPIQLPWGYFRYRILAFVVTGFLGTSMWMFLDITPTILSYWFFAGPLVSLPMILFFFIDSMMTQLKKGEVPWIAKRMHWTTNTSQISRNVHRLIFIVLLVEICIGCILLIQLPPEVFMWQTAE